MTTSNAAADTAAKTETEKAHEKLTEKRRALGRGLESLLPGPRVVPASPARPPAAPAVPQPTRKDGAPDSANSQFSVLSSQESGSALSSSGTGGGHAPEVVDELQAAAAGQSPEGEQALELALDRIEQNPYQTRTEFEPNALAELAASIREQGVLQPIVVRPATLPQGQYGFTTVGSEIVRSETVGSALQPLAAVPPGGKQRYILILGERRFRASKMAGKTTIPAIVKRVSEQQAAEMTLVENLQRQDLHCLEQAVAFAKLSTDFQLTQEAIGKRVGVSREQVSNYLRLLRLPQEVLNALRNGDLTYSHARLLLSLGEESQIVKVARLVIAKKMSVALLEEKVIDSHVPKGHPEEQQSGGARWLDPNVRAAQRSLEAVLGMRVRIRDRRGKGKIVIEYGTLEDFDRVVGMLKGK
jgi:ParB family chromosome partitioning protein